MGPNEAKIQTLLKEFLTVGNIGSCKECVMELKDGKAKSKFVEFVYQLIVLALETKEDMRVKVQRASKFKVLPIDPILQNASLFACSLSAAHVLTVPVLFFLSHNKVDKSPE
jgi:hypothetical protein